MLQKVLKKIKEMIKMFKWFINVTRMIYKWIKKKIKRLFKGKALQKVLKKNDKKCLRDL